MALSFTANDITNAVFQQVSAQLKAYAKAAGVRSLYTIGRKDKQLFFGPESLDPDDPYASPPGTLYEEPSPLDFEIFETGKTTVQGPVSDEYGTFVSAAAPVKNPLTHEVIMTVGIDVEASEWQREIRKVQFLFAFITLIPLSILAACYFLLRLRRNTSQKRYRLLQHTEAIACALIMLLLTLTASGLFHQAEKLSREKTFHSMAQIKAGIYAELLENVRSTIYTLVKFTESSVSIDRQKFATYCQSVVGRDAVQACLWAPVLENNGSASLAYPVLYVEPKQTYEEITGQDLLKNTACEKAIRRTLQTNRTIASDPIRLTEETGPPEILIVRPVNSKHRKGIAAIIVQPESIIAKRIASSAYEQAGLSASLFHLETNSPPQLLTCSEEQQTPDWNSLRKDLHLIIPAFIFGKTYALVITPEPKWLKAHPLRQGKTALIIGLAVSILLTSLIAILSNRPAMLEKLIQQRTAELKFTQFTLDHSADAAYRISPDAIVIYVNDAACKQLGYTQKELLRMSIADFDPSFSEESWRKHWEELKLKKSIRIENSHRKKSGQLFPVEIHVSYIRYDGQECACAFVHDITERVHMLEKLELTHFALDHTADPVFRLNPDSTISYVNKAACKTLGYTRKELLDMSILDIDPSLTKEWWKELWNEVHNKKSIRIETVHQTKDGVIFPVEVHSTSIIFQGKEQHLAFANDITERKRAEEKLQNLTNIQSLILDNSTLGIALVNNRIFEWVNPRLCELMDRPIEKVQGASTRILYSSDEQYEEQGRIAYKTLAGGKRSDNTIQFSRSDGTKFWCRLIGKALNPERPNDGSIWMFEDITEQNEARVELQRLSTAIEQASETVLITDETGIIQYVNPAFEKDSGYSRSEVLGKTPVFLQSGRHDRAFYSNLWNIIQSGKTWTGRFTNQRKDGSIYINDVSISPLQDSSGTITGYVSVQRNITDELEKEERFRQSQKMEAVGQLAGGIAHDFNNILQAIRGFSEILIAKFDQQSAEYQNTVEIRKATRRAAELTRQLLAFSRKQPIDRKRVNINVIIQDADALLQMLLTNRIRCELDLAPDLHDIFADRSQIMQIIMNLAVNARDAMPDGGTLTLKTENITFTQKEHAEQNDKKDYICLTISDTGYGMDQDVQEHLFEPFFTTKAVGKGTGLGLAAVYGIVEQNKGWIHVCSAKDQGSTFKTYLPAFTAGSDVEDQPEQHEQILLVEDDADTRNMVVHVLKKAGYQVMVAKSAEEALTLFDRHRENISMLFTDISLPGQDGIELADLLRTKKQNLPVLLYSGYRDPRELWDVFDKKQYHFIKKPFSITHLLASICKTLADESL